MKNFFISKKLKNDIKEYLEYCKDNDQDHEKAVYDTIMVFGVPRKELIEEISREVYKDFAVNNAKSKGMFFKKIKEEVTDIKNYGDEEKGSDIYSFINNCRSNGLDYGDSVEKAQAFFGLSALYLIEMVAEMVYTKNEEFDDNYKKSILSRAHNRKVEYSDILEFISFHRENNDSSETARKDAMNYFGTSNIDMINHAIDKIYG